MACSPHRPLLLIATAALACGAALAPHRALALDHCGQVTTNQAWSAADNPHDICSTGVSIRNSTLSIQPGAQVRFNDGADLVVQSGAALVAVGDAQNAPIRFFALQRTASPGFWGQIRFETGSLTSTIEAATIAGGGKDGKAMVEVRGTATDLYNVVFSQSAGAPLLFGANSLGPSTTRAGSITVREQRCSLLRFSQVGKSAIEVDATDPVDVTVDGTWANFCVPYLVKGTITIAGPANYAPTLYLGPGALIKFDQDGGIVAGISAEQPGHLVTSGAVDELEHVVITGQRDEPGSWGGILISEFSNIDNSLINTDVKYGGAGGVPMIRVRDPRTYALDLTMRHALGYPLELPSNAVDSFLGGMIAGKYRQPPIKDNGIDRALVLAKSIPLDVPRSAVWGDIGVPYEIDGDLTVASDQGKEGPPAEFRILPGAHLLFAPDAALRIGDPAGPRARFSVGSPPSEPLASRAAVAALGAGALRPADDTADTAVLQGGDVVLGALNGAPGGWQGLVLADTTVEAQIEGVHFENGGKTGAMVQWGKVRGAITRSTFSGAAGYPISIPLSHMDAIMGADQQNAVNRNHYENNGVNRILVQSNVELTQRQLTLADPGAGVEFDGDAILAGAAAPLIDMDAGLRFYLRPGKALRVGDGARRANIRLNDSRGADTVSVMAAEDGKPHGGVFVDAGSSLREADGASVKLMVTGGGAGEAFVSASGAVDLAGLTLTGDAASAGATGLLVKDGAEVSVSGPRFSKLAVGAKIVPTGRLILQKGWITECSQWGVLNEDAAHCNTAALIWWGDKDGPLDPSDAKDDCMNVGNDTVGTKVSDDVDWAGYAIDEQLTPIGGIQGSKKAYLPVGWKSSGR
ncbi:MAG: hypothetical protein ABI780_07895 [Ardenticatenales bacterium]